MTHQEYNTLMRLIEMKAERAVRLPRPRPRPRLRPRRAPDLLSPALGAVQSLPLLNSQPPRLRPGRLSRRLDSPRPSSSMAPFG